jgi:hypothetical protein
MDFVDFVDVGVLFVFLRNLRPTFEKVFSLLILELK